MLVSCCLSLILFNLYYEAQSDSVFEFLIITHLLLSVAARLVYCSPLTSIHTQPVTKRKGHVPCLAFSAAIATVLITLPAVSAVHTVDYLPILAPAFARPFSCCLTGLNIHIHSLLYVPTYLVGILAIPFHHSTFYLQYRLPINQSPCRIVQVQPTTSSNSPARRSEQANLALIIGSQLNQFVVPVVLLGLERLKRYCIPSLALSSVILQIICCSSQ